jgi:hypothetical protein
MNDTFDFERFVVDQFANVAADRPPARSVDQILTEARQMRPLPRWLAIIKEPPMRVRSIVIVGSPALRRTAALACVTALLVALAGAVVAGASLLPSPSPATPEVRNGLITFSSNGDVWVTDIDDTARKQLTTGPSWDSSPMWSPQGDRIAYWTQRTPAHPSVLMLVDADGKNPRALRDLVQERLNLTDGFPPVWNPTGRRSRIP